jgi:S1-C subfamily serine protease
MNKYLQRLINCRVPGSGLRVRIRNGKTPAARLLLALLLVLTGLPVLAQPKDPSVLYKAASPGVVYLRHELYIDGKHSTRQALWERFARAAGKPFLDTWLPLASGSGFFIDDLGRTITNRHVVQIGNLDVLRAAVAKTVGAGLESVYGSQFSQTEREAMLKDLGVLLKDAAYRFSAVAGGQEYASVKVLAQGAVDEPDLALVEVEGAKGPSLRLAKEGVLDSGLTGRDVLSLGFPLGSTLDELFKERVVTMNRGSISAVRATEKLDLQHSAAISHGNSGGPLLGFEGEVFGVNTASLTEAQGNSLFYAVSVDRVRKFLDKHGFANIALWNTRLGQMDATGHEPRLNAAGEFETSPNLFLDIPEGASVHLDGVLLQNSGPQILRLDSATSRLEVVSGGASYTVKLRLAGNLTGTTSLKPPLVEGLAPLELASDPPGAAITADGRFLGRSPLAISLPMGSYEISLDLQGYAFQRTRIDLASKGVALSLAGEPASPLALKGLTPSWDEAANLSFVSGDRRYDFMDASRVALPSGDFMLTITGVEAYRGITIPVRIEGAGTVFDLSPFAHSSSLTIRGFDPLSRVWIDGVELGSGLQNPLILPVGLHSVSIWQDGKQPLLNLPIHVRNDGKSFITWDGQPGYDHYASILDWSALGVGGTGLLAIVAGTVFGLNAVAVPLSSDWENYQSIKSRASLAVSVGSALGLVGGVLKLFSIVANKAFLKQQEGFKPAGVIK